MRESRSMKIIVVLALVGIIAALASAGVFMLRRSDAPGEGRDAKMARALAVRVGLSVTLFLFVLFSYWMGWIQPSGIPAGR